MTKEFVTADVARLAEAVKELKELEDFVIERATIHAGINDKKVNLRTENGYNTRVMSYAIFDDAYAEIPIQRVDSQGGGNWYEEYRVPRDFVFGDPTDEEKDYKEFLRLNDKFGPPVRN